MGKKSTQEKAVEVKDGDKKSSDKDKKNTSLRLDKQTLKALKIIAIEQDTSVQKLIESLIFEYLENNK